MARPPITKARPYTPQSGAFAGQTFHTEREYRNALAKLKGFSSWHEQQRVAKKVTTKGFADLRPSQKQARARALDALSKVRHGSTLTRAAKEAGTTPNTVAKYTGEHLHRERGRMVASKSDRLYRVMNVITTDGVQEVPLRMARGRHRLSANMQTPSEVPRYRRRGAAAQVRGRQGRGPRGAGAPRSS